MNGSDVAAPGGAISRGSILQVNQQLVATVIRVSLP